MAELKIEDLPFKLGELVIAGKQKVMPATRVPNGDGTWRIQGGGGKMPDPAPITAIEIREHGPVYEVHGQWFEASHVFKVAA